MSNSYQYEEGLVLNLITYKKIDFNISSSQLPDGPLVNMSNVTSSNNYIVTVLAYLPSGKTFNPVDESKKNGISLDGDLVYLNYYGTTVITVDDRNANRQLIDCRDFRIEYNCEEGATEYDLHYLQFSYQLTSGVLSVDSILVRETNDDPDTDRGTETRPQNPR